MRLLVGIFINFYFFIWNAFYREKRKEAKKNNWPRSRCSVRRDRNSWIAFELRNSSLAIQKQEEKEDEKEDE